MADDGLTYALQRSIPGLQGDIATLVFREPTAGDILAVGNPVKIDLMSETGDITHDERKMTAMIARLSGVAPAAITHMTPQDWVGCALLLTPFFVPPPPPPPTS